MCVSTVSLRNELCTPIPLALHHQLDANQVAIILSNLHFSNAFSIRKFVEASKKGGIILGSAAAATFAVPLLGAAGLMAAGFGTSGIVAGSLAAAWQSTMGGIVAAGSAFSTFQSIGATGGLIFGPLGVVVGLTAGGIAGGIATAVILLKKKKPEYFKLIYLHV
ncbi:uncharacterized protein LOC110849994 [Folsomia candida]|uniref:Interferon alpha-inducible protein 27, mitochondrial n=1 Tax=Folsomia candida TaxID=158441 RepID=A0A226F139_FOLCA|nr:uncharacterized protein LOC110849994 [Folsomia candida]OXA63147.1 Interferon alpha-inducible protein 27, mitochondrial [Folsomia candida]